MTRPVAIPSREPTTMRPHRPALIAVLALIGLAPISPSAATVDESPVKLRMDAMRDLARAATVVAGKSGAKAELVPEPIYRFDDPTRGFPDGSIWAYGKPGRPAAILCLSFVRWDRNNPSWMHEFSSLTDGPIQGSSEHASGPWKWDTKDPGPVFVSIPQAPAPAETEPRRLVQMKEQARRFKAFESANQERNDPSDRFELRLLPQPIYRYHHAERGQVDGGIFLLSYGRNPEIALVIEARREGNATPIWSYALARLAGARLSVSIDDQEVADMTKPKDIGPSHPYFLIHRSTGGLKD